MQIEVSNKAAFVLNLELNSVVSSYGKAAENIFSTILKSTNILLLVGIVFLTFSTLLFAFACYQRHKHGLNNFKSKGDALLNLGRSVKINGNHHYKEILMNSDEENAQNLNFKSKKVTFLNNNENKVNKINSKQNMEDKKNLLFDEEDDDENDSLDDIFVR